MSSRDPEAIGAASAPPRRLSRLDTADLTRRVIATLATVALPLHHHIRSYVEHTPDYHGDLLFAENTPGRGIRVLIGDVGSVGLAAAIVAIPVAQTFLTMTRKGFDLAATVEEINRNIHVFTPDDSGLACALIEVRRSGRRTVAEVWNGGLPTGYVYRPGHGVLHRLPPRERGLGHTDSEFLDTAATRLYLARGDRLLFHSDGLISPGALNGARVEQHLQESGRDGDAVTGLVAALAEMGGDRGSGDDVTLVDIAMAAVW